MKKFPRQFQLCWKLMAGFFLAAACGNPSLLVVSERIVPAQLENTNFEILGSKPDTLTDLCLSQIESSIIQMRNALNARDGRKVAALLGENAFFSLVTVDGPSTERAQFSDKIELQKFVSSEPSKIGEIAFDRIVMQRYQWDDTIYFRAYGKLSAPAHVGEIVAAYRIFHGTVSCDSAHAPFTSFAALGYEPDTALWDAHGCPPIQTRTLSPKLCFPRSS